MEKILKMAVVGKDVSGSISPEIHTFILNKLNVKCKYDKVSIDPSIFNLEFPKVLKEYDTLNITIPYKLEVIQYLDEIKEDAKIFGSVNTIDVRTKKGYNTDGVGFMLMIETAGVNAKDKNVLVLGSGGVGRSVIKKLLQAGANVDAFDLNKEGLMNVKKEFPEFNALDKIDVKPYDIIVNCTGVGMHKTEGISPVSSDILKLCDVAVDLIYVPKISEFLRIAQSFGKKIINGESILFYQAYYADCIFLGKKADLKEAKSLYEEFISINNQK